MALQFRIEVVHPAARELSVELTLDLTILRSDAMAPAAPTELFLATWTPGSYLVREFSRHLSRVVVTDADSGASVPSTKVAKNRIAFTAGMGVRRVRVAYRVYAHELSVRTADLTAEHAFWNHTCLLLWPVGRPELPATIRVVFPAEWQIACALTELDAPSAAAGGASRDVVLHARDLDEAHDSPCLLGIFTRFDWTVRGVPHAMVIDGLAGASPPATLVADLTAIVEAAAAVFGGKLPYARYLFLVLCTAEGHGGLEHGASTVLLTSRTAFTSPKGYREFLSLAAHELFHAWNVKRMRPVEFWRYDYEAENYTEFLWLIEGWTAYYDDLLCARAGLMSRADYLGVAAKNVNAMLAAPGRHRLSLRESSFDAWIRLYRPDENTKNSSQNYYGNGAVAAMCLDLVIRRASNGARSLDDVVADLYRTTFANGRGYELADVQRALRDAGGDDAVRALAELVDDRLDPPLETLLAPFGVRVQWRETDRPYLGVQFEGGSMIVASVVAGAPAHDAGVQPGDEVLALGGLRVDSNRWADVLPAIAKIGEPLPVLLSRRGVITSCTVLVRNAPGSIALEPDPNADAVAKQLLQGWLPDRAAPGATKPAVEAGAPTSLPTRAS